MDCEKCPIREECEELDLRHHMGLTIEEIMPYKCPLIGAAHSAFKGFVTNIIKVSKHSPEETIRRLKEIDKEKSV